MDLKHGNTPQEQYEREIQRHRKIPTHAVARVHDGDYRTATIAALCFTPAQQADKFKSLMGRPREAGVHYVTAKLPGGYKAKPGDLLPPVCLIDGRHYRFPKVEGEYGDIVDLYSRAAKKLVYEQEQVEIEAAKATERAPTA